jgi:Flp pilus assembly protein TadD
MAAAPADRELRLAEAVVQALSGDSTGAEKRLREVQGRWPEWHRPWIVHGLLLAGAGRRGSAASKFRAAAALGSHEDPAACASLRAWVFEKCGK